MDEYCAGALIEYQGKYLIINQGNYWGLPKGHIEEGETDREAAVREIKEEVDLEVNLIGDPVNMSYSLPNGNLKHVAFFYATAVTDNVSVDGTEVVDALWLEKDAALRKLSFTNLRRVFSSLLQSNT